MSSRTLVSTPDGSDQLTKSTFVALLNSTLCRIGGAPDAAPGIAASAAAAKARRDAACPAADPRLEEPTQRHKPSLRC
jgi:hypothetical protein